MEFHREPIEIHHVQIFQLTLIDDEGRPVSGASVSIYEGGTSTLAACYDADETTAVTNPLTTNSDGYAECYLANGKYDYTAVKDATTLKEVTGEVFYDPDDAAGVGVFEDDTFTVKNATDGTKKAQFDASGITTETTRTYILPDSDGTLATMADLADFATTADVDDAIETAATKFLHVQDQKTSGTAGGTFTSGAWQTRTLNTTLTNEITGASLSSNAVTLPAGTYYFESVSPVFRVALHQSRLYDGSAAVANSYSSNSVAENEVGVGNYAIASGRFTLSAETSITLQHRCSVTFATQGFGYPNSFGGPEVYAELKIWKIA